MIYVHYDGQPVNAADWASDSWTPVMRDGPAHQSRRWQLVNGVRGSYGFGITVYGPNRPLHSGHYGSWMPNRVVD